jgi:hypothetical protein
VSCMCTVRQITHVQKCHLSFWSPSLSVHLRQLHCAVDLILKDFFLKCVWVTLVCWILLVMYQSHFLLSRSNID